MAVKIAAPPDTLDAEEPPAPLAGTRAEAAHRLQVGLGGLAAMILLVGLANIFMERARETEAGVVPDAAPTVAVPAPTATGQRDPLADGGVVPELPDEAPAALPQVPADAAAATADVAPTN